MAAKFNELLRDVGLNPSDVRLLRHADPKRATKGRSPYELWRNNREKFETYQRTQKLDDRSRLKAPYWAVFVATPSKETMFVGLYGVEYLGVSRERTPRVQISDDAWIEAGSRDVYRLTLRDEISDLMGELVIEWGPGYKAWIQRAENQNKDIIRQPSNRSRQQVVQRTLIDDLREIETQTKNATTRETLVNARLRQGKFQTESVETTLTEDIKNVIEDEKIGATEKVAQILARIGQGDFRKRVLQRWDNCCSVTGAKTQEVIRASHIKPWRDCDPSNGERLDVNNGLPLVASLDALFDKGLIAFDSSGEMIVSSKLSNSERQIFSVGGRSLSKKPSKETADYLAFHRENYFQK